MNEYPITQLSLGLIVLQLGRSVLAGGGFRIYYRIMLRITRSAMGGCEADNNLIIVIAA